VKNRVRGPVLALACLIAGSATASAGIIPDPASSDIPNVVVSPEGLLEYRVTIRSSTNTPLDGVMVLVKFNAAADGILCWCAGETHPEIMATTNPAGEAVFFIRGGGCVDPAALGSIPAEVFADGIKMAEVGIVSPDAVDAAGLFPTSGWNPGGNCVVGLSDATFHTGAISAGTSAFCSDMDSDGIVALADAVLLTAPIADGESCIQ